MSVEKSPITKLVHDHLDPVLKSSGFVRKVRVWNRAATFGAHVLDIQSDHKRADGSNRFTINIGVFIDDLWSLCWGKPKPAFVREVECYPRFRLEFLLSGFNPKIRDRWWTLKDAASVTDTGSEISSLIKSSCLPFFDSLQTIADVLRVPVLDQLPLERLQHALLRGLNGEDPSEQLSRLSQDAHWGDFVDEARIRLKRNK